MLEYYKPTPEEYEAHIDRVQPVPSGESVKRSLARTDTTYFAVNQLGLKPYTWQSKFWDDITRGRSVIACTARQLGKTCAISIFCLQSCIYNTMPLKTTGKTRIVVVSKSEAQSKKIISDIKEWMRIGDERVKSLTYKYNKKGEVIKKGIDNWFTSQIDRSQSATNTKGAITFKNGCEIISLPPTDSARGWTGSILFLDEFAFFPDEDIFTQTLRPIVSQTGDRICGTSTPNGQQGVFYKYMDPENKLPEHEFARLWVPYTSLELDAPDIVAAREQLGKQETAMGNELSFQQEHMAQFTASHTSFFDPKVVDSSFSNKIEFAEEWNDPCDLAVDFGKVHSRTVISISALIKDQEGERIRLLYEYEYPPGKDLSLVEDIELLKARFNVQRVIFEDCPQAEAHRQMAEKKGWNLVMFNPTRDKVKKYFSLRSWMSQGKVMMPFSQELETQMKGMIQEETPRHTKIYHGAGLRDDRVDSFMLSTIFFTEKRSGFRVIDVDEY